MAPSFLHLFAVNLPTLVLVLFLVIYINKSIAKVKDDIIDKFSDLKAGVAALAARMDVLEKIILSQHPADPAATPAPAAATDLTEPTPPYNQK